MAQVDKDRVDARCAQKQIHRCWAACTEQLFELPYKYPPTTLLLSSPLSDSHCTQQSPPKISTLSLPSAYLSQSIPSQNPRISHSPLRHASPISHRLHSGPVPASELERIELRHCYSRAPSGIIINLHFDFRLICNVCASIKMFLISADWLWIVLSLSLSNSTRLLLST